MPRLKCFQSFKEQMIALTRMHIVVRGHHLVNAAEIRVTCHRIAENPAINAVTSYLNSQNSSYIS